MLASVDFYRDSSIPFFELKLCNTGKLSYKKHFHEEYSLGIVDEGTSSIWYDGKHVDIEPGNLVFIPPNIPHACNPHDEGNWKYKMLFIHPEWIRNLIEYEREFHKPIIWRNDMRQPCKDLMTEMVDCLTGPATPLEKESVILTVFVELIKTIVDREKFINVSCTERTKLKRVKDYLHDHFLERVTLETLEKVSGLSKFHLVHLFKREYNIPPHAYQTLLRINFAKRELCSQRCIADVAVDVGFFDQSHFTKVFKNYVGVTPEKYQRSL